MDLYAARGQLAAALATVTGWRAYDADPEGKRELPSAVVMTPAAIEFDTDYAGRHQVTLVIELAVGTQAGTPAAVQQLDGGLSAIADQLTDQLDGAAAITEARLVESTPYERAAVGEAVALTTAVSLTVTM